MNNIADRKQQRRRECIERIKRNLKEQFKGELLKIEREEVILYFMSELNLTERVIKEYVKLAEWEIKNKS